MADAALHEEEDDAPGPRLGNAAAAASGRWQWPRSPGRPTTPPAPGSRTHRRRSSTVSRRLWEYNTKRFSSARIAGCISSRSENPSTRTTPGRKSPRTRGDAVRGAAEEPGGDLAFAGGRRPSQRQAISPRDPAVVVEVRSRPGDAWAAAAACSRTNGWFIRNSACGATVLTLRRPVTTLGSAKSKTSNSSGKALRNTGT